MIDVTDLRKASTCVFLATDSEVAQDLSDKLTWAANEIDRLNAELKVQQNEHKEIKAEIQEAGEGVRQDSKGKSFQEGQINETGS